MNGRCRQCKHWQGNRLSLWGDCNHVIFELLALDYTDRFGDKCEAPLDPHDLQYYLSDSGIHNDMKDIPLSSLHAKVKVDRRHEITFWMDDHGEQTVKTKKLTYMQTHKQFKCERYCE